ncbi:cathelicidin antimicrobial peptide precursor [Cavia porcellus]|uniref:Cathelicidin antimicrobial peptide n=1 Tax=Cavia porcellus TaxID=10141 RepID=Q91X12_CAVPO|nr:cathelicidin antimicrobial peptide precursor [Cavia porcellus]BAB60811.1 neutrophil cationic antibacterial polypeptide of 11 kDa [Cavia porcellus]
MGTPRDAASGGPRLLLPLLLLLLLTPATAWVLSYQQAVQRAVDGINKNLADNENLFRLLSLDTQPPGDNDPYSPKPVSFTIKETVCTKMLQRPLEQCDFKENGLVQRCTGTVTLDSAFNVSSLSCLGGRRFRRMVGLRKKFRKTRKRIQKLGRKIGKTGRKVWKAWREYGQIPYPCRI